MAQNVRGLQGRGALLLTNGTQISGAAAQAIYREMGQDLAHQYCFAAGTLVLMADGTRKAIETILAGEMVLAVDDCDPQGGVKARRVVEAYHNRPDALLTLYFGTDVLRVTWSHPFYVQDRGWVPAKDLRLGDRFRSHTGQWVALSGMMDRGQSEAVYNIQVEGSHTYFVDLLESGESVLVHNVSSWVLGGIGAVIGGVLGGIVGAGVSIVTQYVQTGEVKWAQVAGAAVSGAVNGAINGAIIGAVMGAATGDVSALAVAGLIYANRPLQGAIGAVSAAAGNVVEQGLTNGFGNINMTQVGISAAAGAVGGFVGSAMLGGLGGAANTVLKQLGLAVLTGATAGAAGGATAGAITTALKPGAGVGDILAGALSGGVQGAISGAIGGAVGFGLFAGGKAVYESPFAQNVGTYAKGFMQGYSAAPSGRSVYMGMGLGGAGELFENLGTAHQAGMEALGQGNAGVPGATPLSVAPGEQMFLPGMEPEPGVTGIGQPGITGEPLGTPGIEPAPASGFDALAQRRTQLGLPAAGTAEDVATLARLEINGQTFDGINRGLQNPVTKMSLDRVNAQTLTHAEADVVQQAVDAGMKGTATRAEMWVDRDPCGACGPNGGLRSLARNLGVEELTVHSPSGTQVVTPRR